MHLNRPSGPKSAPTDKQRKRVAFATQPSDAFRTADGHIVISAYIPKHWELLCRAIDRPDLLDDERFADQRSRAINYAELTDELESTLTTKPADEWVKLLRSHGLMACLPYSWKQVVETPLFAENDLALEVGDGDEAVTVVRTPARYSTFTADATEPPPGLGEHNDDFLTAP
jgi:crotonobetainyl-CoA:carnitine CoA-transferase CaiB-like acyl-CoA transferase